MAKKIAKNVQNKIKSARNEKQVSSRDDQVMVLLENVRDEIKLAAEGNLMLGERMETGFKEVNGRIDLLEYKIELVNDKVETVKADLQIDLAAIREEMRAGFKGMMAETMENDKKIEQKAEKRDLIILEKRVAKLETAS